MHGFGEIEYEDRRHYKGNFENDKKHGEGVLTEPNGNRFEGVFLNDSPDVGTYFNSQGKIIKTICKPE